MPSTDLSTALPRLLLFLGLSLSLIATATAQDAADKPAAAATEVKEKAEASKPPAEAAEKESKPTDSKPAEAKTEEKPEAKPEVKPEAKQEKKADEKPAKPKKEAEPAKPAAEEPKAEAKPEPKKITSLGYSNTPFIRGQRWKVHDMNRPRPRAIVPGNASTYEKPGTAPSDAIVLFDGNNLDNWGQLLPEDPGSIYQPLWSVADGAVTVVPETGHLRTLDTFADCQLHIEWASPEVVQGASQERGDSGVLLMGKYEVQILDSFNNRTFADGQAGAIFGQHPPMVNASRPSGQWQVYDIVFEAPTFKDGKLESPAYMTVIHNGILLHHRRELVGSVKDKELQPYSEDQPAGPIVLQNHGTPVRYRNIWIRPLN